MILAPSAIAAEISATQLVQLGRERRRSPVHLVQAAGHVGLISGQVALTIDLDDLAQGIVVQHRERQHQPATRRWARVEQVTFRTDRVVQRGHQLLADRIQRGVGHLREQLGEVVEQQPRLVTERRQRCVGAHRTERLDTGGGHRRQDQPQLLFGVAEDLLATSDRGMRVHHMLPVRQVGQQDPSPNEPFPVRCCRGELGLDLLVGDDPVLAKINEKHPARLQAGPSARSCPAGCPARRPLTPAPPSRRRSPRSVRDASRCDPAPRPPRCRR